MLFESGFIFRSFLPEQASQQPAGYDLPSSQYLTAVMTKRYDADGKANALPAYPVIFIE